MENNNSNEIVKETLPKKKKEKKEKKLKKLKNQYALKKGGFSAAIIVVVLTALILFNWFVSVLSDRVSLEFNMSPNESNTVSEENLKYIRKIDSKVNILVCSDEDNYSYYMSNYWCQNKNVTADTSYFSQTLTLINEYKKANKNIKIQFAELNSSDFSKLSNEYGFTSLSPAYGDIIVYNTENSKYKKISFDDIYETYDSTGYASYGMGASYQITGNNIEKSLTSAVSYVLSSQTKKIAILTGHSENVSTENYENLLKDNNFETQVISDSIITSVSSDFDAIAIIAPSKDFFEQEINAVSSFLENDGKLNKGLIYFADSSYPYLPNISSFLSDYGIVIEEGKTFSAYPYGNDPATGYSLDSNGAILSNATCLTGKNVPLLTDEPADKSVTVTALLSAYNGGFKVPSDAADDYSVKKEDYAAFATAVQAKKSDYDSDGKEISSYVTVFSSSEFINSEWVDYQNCANKDVVLAVTERNSDVGTTDIKFVTKTIENESYKDKITNGGKSAVVFFFIFLIPVLTVVSGIVIYIRRRNAQ